MTLNGRMTAAAHITLVVTSIDTNKQLIQKNGLQSYSIDVKDRLQKFANDQEVVEMDSKILCYTRPARIISMQYADDLYAKLTELHMSITNPL